MKTADVRAVSRRGLAVSILLFLFAPLLFCSSCARREAVRQELPVISPYTGRVDADLLRQSAGFRNIKSIRAAADVAIYREGVAAGSLSGVFGYLSPDRIKASFFGPFGVTVLEILLAKETLQVSLPTKNMLYETAQTGISFSGQDGSRWLYSMQEDPDFYQLIAYERGGSLSEPVVRFLFDRTYLLNRRIIAYKGSERFLSIDFSDFNGPIPERMKLSFAGNIQIDLVLSGAEYDADIPSEYFLPSDRSGRLLLPFAELARHLDPRHLQ